MSKNRRTVIGITALLSAAIVISILASNSLAVTLKGGFDNDRLSGSAKADTLRGGFGNDRLYGLGGADRLYGDYGNDRLFGGAGRDTLSGADGVDLLDGGPGVDVILGGDGNDRVLGRGGDDRIDAGDGNDRVDPGPGRDRVQAGDGNDNVLVRDGAIDTVSCGEGTDTVVADPNDQVSDDCEVVSPPTAKPVGSSREKPYPLGTPAPTDDGWSVQVLSVVPDATAAVLATNMFNDPPPAGEVFTIARVRATRTGPTADNFDGGYRLRAVGASAVVRSTFQNSCGVTPDDFPDYTDVYPGGVVEGNICWSVPAFDVGSLVMVDEPFLSSAQRFFALS